MKIAPAISGQAAGNKSMLVKAKEVHQAVVVICDSELVHLLINCWVLLVLWSGVLFVARCHTRRALQSQAASIPFGERGLVNYFTAVPEGTWEH